VNEARNGAEQKPHARPEPRGQAAVKNDTCDLTRGLRSQPLTSKRCARLGARPRPRLKSRGSENQTTASIFGCLSIGFVRRWKHVFLWRPRSDLKFVYGEFPSFCGVNDDRFLLSHVEDIDWILEFLMVKQI